MWVEAWLFLRWLRWFEGEVAVGLGDGLPGHLQRLFDGLGRPGHDVDAFAQRGHQRLFQVGVPALGSALDDHYLDAQAGVVGRVAVEARVFVAAAADVHRPLAVDVVLDEGKPVAYGEVLEEKAGHDYSLVFGAIRTE